MKEQKRKIIFENIENKVHFDLTLSRSVLLYLRETRY